MSSNPQPSEILRAAAKHAPVVLPAPLGDAAAAWLLAEANCHESVHEVGSTFVGMVDSIASNRGSPTRYSVAISTVNTAVELAQGLSHRQIARKMHLSYNTVRSHTLYLRHFFGVHSNVDAVAKARLWDVLEEVS